MTSYIYTCMYIYKGFSLYIHGFIYVGVSAGVTACSRQCRRVAVGARVTAQVMILIKRMHAIAHHLDLYYLMTLFLEACKPKS